MFLAVQMSHNATALVSVFTTTEHNESPLEAVYVSNTHEMKEKCAVLYKTGETHLTSFYSEK